MKGRAMSLLLRCLLAVLIVAGLFVTTSLALWSSPGSGQPCVSDADCGIGEDCLCERADCGSLKQRTPPEMLNRCYRRSFVFGTWW